MKQSDALLLLNAYRLGAVPQHIQGATVIRPELFTAQERLIEGLEGGIPQVLMIEGPYGAGKTHALKDMQSALTLSGFVVSTITLEPHHNILRPDLLYYHIMHHLRLQNKPASFEDLFGIWIDNLKNAPTKLVAANEIKWVTAEMSRHHEAFANGFTHYIRASLRADEQQANRIAAWLKGDTTISPSLYREIGIRGGVDRTKAFDFLKAFAKLIQLIGYSGLVIAIDELDLLLKMRSDQREKAYGTLRQLIDEQIGGSFGALGLILCGTPDVFLDEELGIKSYSPLAQRLGLETSSYSIKEPFISLKNNSVQVIYQLSQHLHSTYLVAYGSLVLPNPKDITHLILMDFKKNGLKFTDITWRNYIQHYLGFLDDVRKRPHQRLLKMTMHFKLLEDGTMHFTNKLT